MKLKIVLTVFFTLILFFKGRSQSMNKLEFDLGLGMRNFGLATVYKLAQNYDVVAGIDIDQYNGLYFYPKVKLYTGKKFMQQAFDGGSVYFACAYKLKVNNQFSEEQQDHKVVGFKIANFQYFVPEIGYRYNMTYRAERESIASVGKYFHLDLSAGITYAVPVKQGNIRNLFGTDVENSLKKLNQFYNGGIGFVFTFHVLLNKKNYH
jgi:hypothetical protein